LPWFSSGPGSPRTIEFPIFRGFFVDLPEIAEQIVQTKAGGGFQELKGE